MAFYLELDGQQMELRDVWLEYLEPYLLDFSEHYKVEYTSYGLSVPFDEKGHLLHYIETALIDLLAVSYVAPTQEQASKYSSRYEKITVQGKVYKVDYRSDKTGIIAYGLWTIINWANSV